MHIDFVEVSNFRKLQAVRIDLTDQTTLLVGANNSGKTSAMVVLKRFLVENNKFTVNDFTLSNWSQINLIGATWLNSQLNYEEILQTEDRLIKLLPSLDVWLNVAIDEIHLVNQLVPSLDWEGGLLGIRFRLEPKKFEDLISDYKNSFEAAQQALDAAQLKTGDEEGGSLPFGLWPESLGDFLGRRMKTHLHVQSYPLDPTKVERPTNGCSNAQELPEFSEAFESNPLKALIKIDVVDAQRGFSDLREDSISDSDDGSITRTSTQRKLSDQLRSYYKRHLDPTEAPDPSDVAALFAIKKAQDLFDDKLGSSFAAAISEVENLGYPGVTDPTLTLSSRLRPVDGLNHSAAVQYSVIQSNPNDKARPLLLPEETNGLGYQNLISMIFRLMSFRDDWMKVGKASLGIAVTKADENAYPPIHLVLLEEPEAHLHIQVQQVFMQKAYEVLRKHDELGSKKTFTTQLVVSTHSSHIAHESEFSTLRYFRRKPASKAGQVPLSYVINLSEVFGEDDKTQRFVKRYLRTSHCDLFFADAAILVEGPAERMLVPHFIRNHYATLTKCYITIMEIGGSHAHRFRSLIEHLGLTTLLITDLDASNIIGKGNLSPAPPKRKAGMVSGNFTIRNWLPSEKNIDTLLDMPAELKVRKYDEFFAVRVAYQDPINVQMTDVSPIEEALAYTFEDALVFSNVELFKTIEGIGLIRKFKKAISSDQDVASTGQIMFDALGKGDKAQFALDLFYMPSHPLNLCPPRYIKDGLDWLQQQMAKKQLEVVILEDTATIFAPATEGAQ